MNVEVTELSPALGAEVGGVDIAAGVTEPEFRVIRDAWHASGLILLRNQRISEDQQVDFGRRFGEVAPWSHFADQVDARGGNPFIMQITNLKEDGEYIGSLAEGEIEFHSDGIYIEEPTVATMLYAIEVTSSGGETAFANLYTAFDTLPADIKDRIEGKSALHAFTYDSARSDLNEARKRNWDDVVHCVHPVVRTHPVTGRRALYVNRLMTQEIVGMEAQESRELLNILFDHMENPAFIYEHRWRKGDVLLWDNRCLAHARRDFPADQTRLLRRLTLKGERPA